MGQLEKEVEGAVEKGDLIIAQHVKVQIEQKRILGD